MARRHCTDHATRTICLDNMGALCNRKTSLCNIKNALWDMGALCDMRTALCDVGEL